MTLSLEVVEEWLHDAFVGVPEARLRRADLRKAVQVHALLQELTRARKGARIIDAAAGRSALGLLAARLGQGRGWSVHAVERDGHRLRAAREAARRWGVPWTGEEGLVAELGPADAVVALHACGAATDAVIEAAAAHRVPWLLVVPCCYGGGSVHGRGHASPWRDTANEWATALGVPSGGLVRRRFVQAWIDSERTLRLEALGYEVEVAELVPPRNTPFHLLWRARWVGLQDKRGRAWRRFTASPPEGWTG